LETNPDFKAFPKIAIHQQDGYQGLKSFLPFKEKRGLIFIDPPFEKNSEWTDLLKYINLAYSRFPQGIYAIWYPIKDQHEVRNFLQKMVQEFSEPECKDLKTRPQILNIECVLDSAYSCMTTRIRKTDYSNSLMGTGMLILNPPWQIELELEVVINWLWTKMQFNEKGFCSVKWLMRDYIC
jgi:23S rRNA (adenine2030-N6)-methyltransferase